MTKKSKKDQLWFDKRYSKEQVINIIGNRRLNFAGSLKIEGSTEEDFTTLKDVYLKKLQLTGLEIINCPQLEKIGLSELGKLTTLEIIRCSQFITLEIIGCSQLTALEIIGSQLDKIELSKFGKHTNLKSLKVAKCSQLKKIIGLSKLDKLKSLSVTDCSELKALDCSSTGLNELEVSDLVELNCSKTPLTELDASDLIELNCSNTSIEKLSLNLCPDIKKLSCSDNNKLINLDISNCSKLEHLDCSRSKLTILDLSNCSSVLQELEINKEGFAVSKSDKVDIPRDCKVIWERKTKNLIIIGRTGGGKSTLSNVLTGTNEFNESSYSISITKNFQKKDFKWNGKDYRVVDTIGVGDTRLTTKQVLRKILDGFLSMPEGISQVLFVIDGRFTAEEASTFQLFKDSVFNKDDGGKGVADKANRFRNSISVFGINDSNKDDSGILEYITIVRTKFGNYKNKVECEKDKKQLLEENKTIADVVKSCRDIIYVNNPPTNINIEDSDDEETVKNNSNLRKKSRKILLDYLDEVCSQEKYFKLKTWDKLREYINKYLNDDRDDLPAELAELEPLVKIVQTFGCSIM